MIIQRKQVLLLLFLAFLFSLALEDSEAWHGREGGGWLAFENVNGLTIFGGGVFNGSGKHERDVSRKYNPGPLLTISGCQNVTLDSITIQSLNTNGIHLSYSRNVVRTNSNISTGDDCISIGDHVQNVTIIHVKCRPGQGTRTVHPEPTSNWKAFF